MLDDKDIEILRKRFWEYVNINGSVSQSQPWLGPCWIWTGTLNHDNYGVINRKGADGRKRQYRAARLAWFLQYGEWPNPMALHYCDNNSCVRWSHLWEGTNTDNMRDASRKGRLGSSDRTLAARAANNRAATEKLLEGMAC